MTGCVIMASGLGKRFGGNKLLAYFGGEPLIYRAVRVSEGLFQRYVLVTRHPEVAVLFKDAAELSVVLHSEPLRSDTVRLGMAEMDGMDHVLFLQGDQPLLTRGSLERMLKESEYFPESIIRLSFRGEAGSPVLFPSWAFPELSALPPGKGGSAVIKAHPDSVRLIEADFPGELLDADTPEELEYLSSLK